MKLMDNLNQQWSGLNRRDQLSLKVLAAFLAVLLVWFGLIQPIENMKERNRSELERRLELNSWLQEMGPQAKLISGNRVAPSTDAVENLSTRVIQLARQHGLVLKKFENDNQGGLRVWFEQVPFESLSKMLAQLQQSGIVASQMTIERQNAAGVVDARGLLSNS
jgi:type II secretory pathway component PulM